MENKAGSVMKKLLITIAAVALVAGCSANALVTTPTAPPVYLPTPISGNAEVDQFVTMLGADFPASTTDLCPTSGELSWNATGYKTFTATVGIADNDPSALGKTAVLTFHDQDGKRLADPVSVTLGKPQKVTVNLNGATRMQVVCKEKPSGGTYFSFVLGDGAFNA